MKEITLRYATALVSLKKDENQLIDSQKEIKELLKILIYLYAYFPAIAVMARNMKITASSIR